MKLDVFDILIIDPVFLWKYFTISKNLLLVNLLFTFSTKKNYKINFYKKIIDLHYYNAWDYEKLTFETSRKICFSIAVIGTMRH